MRIDYSKRFLKRLAKSPYRVRVAFQKKLQLFIDDKFHPLLNNHVLTGKYIGYRSINITGDWRVIFQELEDGEVIFFLIIGTHSQLYK